VAGDLNNDGADDLVIGNSAGQLSLIVNDTPAMRTPVEHPTADIAHLLQVRLLSVRVTGLTGVVGARVTVTDADGRVVGRGDIGGNVASGCRGPDTINFAVRGPGRYTVTVRYADGLTNTWPVDLTEVPRVTLTAERGDEF
jgi:hypothetical protein